MSDTTASPLFAALAKAQGEMTGAVKDRANPHFKSTYATLASVVDAIRGPLSRHGIAYVQRTSVEGRTVQVETLLLHGSGEQYSCGVMRAEAKDGGPQAIGSAHTYLRRYSLMSAVGIAPEDDDGEQGQPQQQPEPPKPAAKPVDARAEAMTRLMALGLEPAAIDRWLASSGKQPLGQRDAAQLSALVTALGKPGRSGFDAWVVANEGSGS